MSGLRVELSETEREVIRIKAAQAGVDSVLLYVERLLTARLAAEREAGAAEVRARVEAVLSEREAELERTRIITIPEWRRTVGIEDFRAALNGGE